MIRIMLIMLLLAPLCGAWAQQASFTALLAAGKAEFKKEYEQQNFRAAVAALEAAVQLQPANPEAHYFLGYAYSRLNSKSGGDLPRRSATLVLKTSREMELVSRLAPRYAGELLALDPYGKLTGEWGALALAYATRHEPDSVQWAYAQGRQRGGFDDFLLGNARAVLDQCHPGSILLTPGDLVTFPVLYLQLHQGYRRDVSVLDVGLLASDWYPAYLEQATSLRFGLAPAERDTMAFLPWRTGLASLPNARRKNLFKWKVYPTLDSTYLQRSDLLALMLLRNNAFQRDVYFTHAFRWEDQLGLRQGQELLQRLVVYLVNADREPELPFAQYQTGMEAILKNLTVSVNPNSRDEREMVQTLRYDVLDRINASIAHHRPAEVKPLLAFIERYVPEASYPFVPDSDEKKYYDYVRSLP
ncbi:MAG: tetratricopeptide repeat protein [Hymenobacter sp.]|nr:MAG: tetratricopeptide repeat protein [Hymenobacter sp.]